jgi:Resolvase, N terminal domain
MLTVLGGLAEFERELIRARTSEGRARAVANGVKLGRKPRIGHHFGGLAHRPLIGHHEPVFLPGQTLCEPPDLVAQLRALDHTPGVLLAFAQRHQPREQALEGLVHLRIGAIPGQSREHRLGALRQRALDPADLVVALARDLLALLPPRLGSAYAARLGGSPSELAGAVN